MVIAMLGVLYCPFCGAGQESLMLITITSPGVEPAGEDWYCGRCETFFTISDVERRAKGDDDGSENL